MRLGQWLLNKRAPCALVVIGVLALPAFVFQQSTYVTDSGGQIYNVKAYGATGNGSTDDTAAINAAVAQACYEGGGIVYFPAGTYKFSSTVTDSACEMDAISLVGAGRRATFLNYTGTGDAIYFADNVINHMDSGEVKGFTLWGTSAAASGIHEEGLNGFTIDQVEIGNNNTQANSFSSGPAIKLSANTSWSEHDHISNVQSFNNKIGIQFTSSQASTASFGYGNFDVWCGFNAASTQTEANGNYCLDMEGQAFSYHSNFTINANLGSWADEPPVIYLNSSGNGGPPLSWNRYFVTAEVQAGGSGHWADAGPNTTGSNALMDGLWYLDTRGLDDNGAAHATGNITSDWFTTQTRFGNTSNGTINGGQGAPSGSCTNGSIYANSTGSTGSTLYVCVSGSWVDDK